MGGGDLLAVDEGRNGARDAEVKRIKNVVDIRNIRGVLICQEFQRIDTFPVQ